MNRTIQREAIRQELKCSSQHPTADEIYIKLRIKLPQISLATVYRNLEQMAALGIIRKITIAGHQARFDSEIERHFHVRCIKCGTIHNLRQQKLIETDRFLKDFIAQNEFSGYEFEFQHICENCRRNAALQSQDSPKPKTKILTMFDD